ncbi:MAG: OadG family protein, partial [Clostridia bacterium]|nr:OadG family protein [Clostridia bacterium]
VWLVGKLLARLQGGVASESREEQSVIAPVKAVQTETEGVDEETLAVITAAIMAYYEQQNSRCEFTVKRIKTIKRY